MRQIVFVIVMLLMACAADTPSFAPLTVGPWLTLDRIAVQNDAVAWTVSRTEERWEILPGSWVADDQSIGALTRMFQAPHRTVDVRIAADSGRALGVVGRRRIDVAVHPARSPAVRFALGDYEAAQDCTWVLHPGQPDHVFCVSGDIRTWFESGPERLRSDRVATFDDADVVTAVVGARVFTRAHRQWQGDRPNALAIDRVLRALASARGTPGTCDPVPRRARVVVNAGNGPILYALGGPGARCLSIDDTPMFLVDESLSSLLLRAERQAYDVEIPDMGTPDSEGVLTVRESGRIMAAEFSDWPRGFVRAATQMRSDGLAGPAFAALARLRPQREVTMQVDGEVHHVALWWHHARPLVLARVDRGPLFFAAQPGALRASLADIARPQE